jgi:hypothetical protein
MAPTARQVDECKGPFKQQNHPYKKGRLVASQYDDIDDDVDMVHETTVRQLHGKV